jgi:hypothetical protein
MIQFVMVNWQMILAAVNAVLAAGVAIALLIPGDQPEKAFRAVADMLSKISTK